MDAESTPVVALQCAVERAGSQAALARIAGVSQQAISKLIRRSRPLPPEHVLTVERETGISRHDLRPDVYGPAPSADATRDAQLIAIK